MARVRARPCVYAESRRRLSQALLSWQNHLENIDSLPTLAFPGWENWDDTGAALGNFSDID